MYYVCEFISVVNFYRKLHLSHSISELIRCTLTNDIAGLCENFYGKCCVGDIYHSRISDVTADFIYIDIIMLLANIFDVCSLSFFFICL